ncbi:hypothetical protein C2S52_013936 [Perilla frutescens var. hirtella]|nr:hypothetical protein C2S51_016183 [Perilla frutescens var. frutescens]KAH6776375.1 hypothetical protein C2S52_013936 [Perilla frutescens var. hirtella]
MGMIDCLDVLFAGDIDLQAKIVNEEFPKYRTKELIFGKAIAVKGCSLNDANFDPIHPVVKGIGVHLKGYIQKE